MSEAGKAAAIAHGGVGAAPEHSDGCRAAVEASLAALAAGRDPLEAAIAGVLVLEDDPRFNAGTGSVVRLDGSVQMDASLMDSEGRFGAVAGVERVKNPILVARAVLETPHLLIAGDGANELARSLGLPAPATDRPPARKLADATDTVGVAVRTAEGRFAVALSTGGTAVSLRGRVGDVPIYGAGLYAGAAGAAAATGVGERIVEQLLAFTTHGWLAAGTQAQEAAERAVALVDGHAPAGIIVLTREAFGVAANRPMAWAAREADGEWRDPTTK